MIRVLDIALKDLVQILRDRKAFLFLLLMPVVFTLMFGYAFGGFGAGDEEPRLPVGWLDQDQSPLSRELRAHLSDSTLITLLEQDISLDELQAQVRDQDLAAAIQIPSGFDAALRAGDPLALILLGDPNGAATSAIEREVLGVAKRLASARRSAGIVASVGGREADFEPALAAALQAWKSPPIVIEESAAPAAAEQDSLASSMAHSSPGMMIQFAIAGLLVAAQVLVDERNSRALQRMLTTATSRVQILLGHFSAIFILILGQFIILILFGHLLLGVRYLDTPLATLLVAVTGALCIAGLGLLIGVLAKNEDQAVVFALLPMFLFSGLGGAWFPLEFTGESFQKIGHITPVAWAMDGFKNLVARGLGIESVLIPAAALVGYALLFFALAAWRFQRSQEI